MTPLKQYDNFGTGGVVAGDPKKTAANFYFNFCKLNRGKYEGAWSRGWNDRVANRLDRSSGIIDPKERNAYTAGRIAATNHLKT